MDVREERKAKSGGTSDGGFTLVEVMFAAGTLALALTLLFGSLISINLMGEVNEGRAKASNHLASVMESLRSRSLNDVITQEIPLYTEDHVEIAVALEAVNTSGERVSLPVTDVVQAMAALPDPVEVVATAVWTDTRGRMYTSTASTMVGR
ncbi:MAG: hypothetical protein GXY15_10475 [Candidatus Hydrogenedentes bacterium]|nr:hypothetical protein [Candidatus Hydrogenedentota bacterium]